MCKKFGPKIKLPYSEIALFEFALFEDLLRYVYGSTENDQHQKMITMVKSENDQHNNFFKRVT